MDAPFIYDRFVTGKNFIARKTECNSLRNLLENKENVCIYEPPKTGKMSLVQQTLFNMRISGKQYLAPCVDLFNVRSLKAFLLKFCSAILRQTASTPAEYAELVGTMLAGTHFSFDQESFAAYDEVAVMTGEPDENDIRSLLLLPEAIAGARGCAVFMIVEEFQDIMKLGESVYEKIFSIMQDIFTRRDRTCDTYVSYILTGSRTNAMKFIFEERKYFHRTVEHIPLGHVDSREITDHIMRGFLTGGKVIDQDLLAGAVELFKGNLWYISHFAAVCDSLSKGFMNEGTMMDALGIVLSIHEPRFKAQTDDLSVHQLSLLRAILDGETKFSSVEVVEKYGLNSSANVRRVKDALRKKEIITFNEKDEAVFLDPLFEYWLGKYYFGKA